MKTKLILLQLLIILSLGQNLNAQTVYYDNITKLYGIINSNGIDILKPTYANLGRLVNGVAMFEVNNKWGLIDNKGTVILKAEIESSYDFGESNEGLIALKKNGKWGYINLKGETVINFQYDWTMQFCGGIAWVQLNKMYNFIDIKGELVSDIWYRDIFISKGTSFADADTTGNHPKVYEIGINGKKIMDSDFIMGSRIYCDASPNSKLIRFRSNDNSPYGYKDQNKKLVIEPKYGFASEFDSGVAVVTKRNISNGVVDWYIIDEKGTEFFQLSHEWKTINGTDMSFHNGLLELQDTSKGDYILINTKGEVIKRMNKL